MLVKALMHPAQLTTRHYLSKWRKRSQVVVEENKLFIGLLSKKNSMLSGQYNVSADLYYIIMFHD